MAMSRFRPLVAICFIVILGCQTWSGAAYSNQQTKWLTKHLSQPQGERVVSRPDRHLQESTTTGKSGYRATLVNEDHKLHARWGLTGMERLFHAAEKSWSRALSLDAKARAATYYKGTSTTGVGRKALQVTVSPSSAPSPSYESPVEATPGSYSMAFSLGTPPQNFIAIADTGSDLAWIQCAACTDCFPQTSPLFQPGNSTTYQTLGCSAACNELGGNLVQCSPTCLYTYSYGDQSSTKGDFSTDTVTLGNINSTNTTLVPDFKFGCGLQNNGTFIDTDGIVGLARGPISFPSQIAPYLNNHTKFSYCLVLNTANSTVTSPIIFGEAAVPTNVTGLVYTPMLSPYNVSDVPYYYVSLQSISVGGVNVSVPASAFQIDASGNGGTIFDSGTTYTTLASLAYTPMLNEFMTQIGTTYPQVDLSQSVGLDLCYDITGQASVIYPPLTFHFENADFDLDFDNIMVLAGDMQSTYMCLAIMSSPGMTIFGNTQQQDFQVIYEEDALQIGWKSEDCASV